MCTYQLEDDTTLLVTPDFYVKVDPAACCNRGFSRASTLDECRRNTHTLVTRTHYARLDLENEVILGDNFK